MQPSFAAIVLVLLLAYGDGVAAASDPGPFRAIARSRGPVVSDGNSNAAYIDRRGTTRVLDHRGRVIRTLPTPRPGREYFIELVAIRSGYVLWDAYHRGPPFTAINEVARAWVGSVAAGAVAEVDTSPWRQRYADAFPLDVGVHWIEADTNGAPGDTEPSHPTYLNWRTGAVIPNTRQQLGNVATVTPDLDLPELWRPLCPPLRRPPDNMAENEGFVPYLRYHYVPPFGVPQRETYFSLQLYRCGGERPRILSRCRSNCWTPQLGPAALVWIERGQARVHRLVPACTRRVRLPSERLVGVGRLVHTRSRLFAARKPSGARRWIVYAARLPRCR